MKKTLIQKFEESLDMAVPDDGIIRFRQDSGVSVSSAPPTTDENPRHQEDFSRLLNAAARGRKPADQT